MPPADRVSSADIDAAGLLDWRRLAQGLWARYRVSSLAAGAKFAAEVADATSHATSVRLGPGWVQLELATAEDGWWITSRDLDAARSISALAAAAGLEPDPVGLGQVEVGLDTPASPRIAPFWAAVLLGSGALTHGEVIDADRLTPALWFQDAPDPSVPQRFHLDVWVAPEVAAPRIAAAVAAGGMVVDETEAPTCTVLADADGNRVCICTSTGR